MSDEPTGAWTYGYIEVVEDTFEAFARSGADRDIIYRAVQLMGMSASGREKLWDKLNQIAACTEAD